MYFEIFKEWFRNPKTRWLCWYKISFSLYITFSRGNKKNSCFKDDSINYSAGLISWNGGLVSDENPINVSIARPEVELRFRDREREANPEENCSLRRRRATLEDISSPTWLHVNLASDPETHISLTKSRLLELHILRPLNNKREVGRGRERERERKREIRESMGSGRMTDPRLPLTRNIASSFLTFLSRGDVLIWSARRSHG